jgi:lipopolysaccharide export system permease protein
VLIYLTYSNLINLAQAWVRSGSMSFWMALADPPDRVPVRAGAVPLPRRTAAWAAGGGIRPAPQAHRGPA